MQLVMPWALLWVMQKVRLSVQRWAQLSAQK
jgi:hypothetical protein